MAKYLIVCLLIVVLPAYGQEGLRELFTEGKQAYDSGDYQIALEKFYKFDSLRSNYPPVNAYLAMLFSRTNNPELSVDYLTRTAIISADTSLLSREDFDNIRETSEFSEVENLFLFMLDSVKNSELAFTLEDATFHPETMAFDSESSRFFIGSIRKRKILVYESGIFREFKTEGEDGLMAVTGLAIDVSSRVLWVCSASLKQMAVQGAEDVGSAVHAYDLETGELLISHRVNKEDVLLGDLVLDKNGVPFMTNSITPEIYLADSDSLYQWKSFPDLLNLQGLVFNEKGDLFFSDYIKGIYRLNESSLTRLEHDPEISTKGIDGLYYKNGNLLVMQNGVNPMRVAQLVLNESEDRIEKAIYLDKNLADLDEPVQGTWVGDWFYFISNSPWRYYQENQLNKDVAPPTQIRRVNLMAH